VNIPLTPLEPLHCSAALNAGIKLWIKRDDLIHPTASGNKWYKLTENIKAAKNAQCNQIISFGGGYSNHLHALALTGRVEDIKTVGIVRGDYRQNLTPTLLDCQAAGMELVFVDKAEWKKRVDPEYLTELSRCYESSWLIPEGGQNQAGFDGARYLGRALAEQSVAISPGRIHVFLACGTGTTLAGVVAELPENFTVHGVSVLKGVDTLANAVKCFLRSAGIEPACQWSIDGRWHCGGYAKFPGYLADFVVRFEREQSFLLDPVYTAKVLYAVERMAMSGDFTPGDHVLVVHTGGLQGRRGFKQLTRPDC